VVLLTVVLHPLTSPVQLRLQAVVLLLQQAAPSVGSALAHWSCKHTGINHVMQRPAPRWRATQAP
jgi:hypothetical protein